MTSKRLAFVGEARGTDEDHASKKAGKPMPLVGASGRLFNSLLSSIGLVREIVLSKGSAVAIKQPSNILVTNVFNEHPKGNKIGELMVGKKLGDLGWPALERGKYLDPERKHHIERLFDELRRFKPDVIVAMGNTPLWALCKVTGIMARRGCYHQADIPGITKAVPVIPTIHPAFILRKMVWMPLAMSDFQKAAKLAEGRLKLAKPKFIAEPTITDVRKLLTLKGPLAVDIETLPAFRAITCVGVGDTTLSVCVPFVDNRKPGRNYWPTLELECEAWSILQRVLENPRTAKILQVAGYDCTWLREIAGVEVRGAIWDTRLGHHALWPELPHDLGAITTSFPDVLFPPWKAQHKSTKADN